MKATTILTTLSKESPNNSLSGDFCWDETGNATFKETPNGKFKIKKKFKDGTYLIQI